MSRPRPLVSALLLLAGGAANAQTLLTWDAGLVAQPGQETYHNFKPYGSVAGLPVGAGDLNGDGLPDTVITPFLVTSGPLNDRIAAGEAYIWWGNGTIAGVFDGAGNPPNRSIVYGASANDNTGNEVAVADVNGDGIDDLLLPAQNGDGPAGSRPNCGTLWIVFGSTGLSGNIDLLAPPPGVTAVHGKDAGDRLGIWVRSGDLDGDGIQDLLVGADRADGPLNNKPSAGETYVIRGVSTWPGAVDLAAPPAGIDVTTIYGIDAGDHAGCTISSGDVDGDGNRDLVFSAAINRAGAQTAAGGDGPGNGRPDCGETYVVFGPLGNPPATVDLAAPPPGVAITTIYGPDPYDYAGEELRAGDFDGDGIDDLAIGALTADGPSNAKPLAGEGYLLRGGAWLRGVTIDLAAPPAYATIVYGANAYDIAADTLGLADANADGRADLAVGSPNADPLGRADAGDVWILLGSSTWPPAVVDLAAPPPNLPLVRFVGAEPGDMLAYSMEATDHDLDGYADYFPNAMGADGYQNQFPDAGDAMLVSGFRVSQLSGLPLPFTVTGQATAGGTLRFNTPGPAGSLYLLAAAFGSANLALPPFGVLGIDPATLFLFHAGTIPPSGLSQLVVPVASPVLAPVTVWFQAFVLTNPAIPAGFLTNAVSVDFTP